MIKGVTGTIENKTKGQKAGFLIILSSTLGIILLSNLLTEGGASLS